MNVFSAEINCFPGWLMEPSGRPTFTDLKDNFQQMIDDDQHKYLDDYNDVSDITRSHTYRTMTSLSAVSFLQWGLKLDWLPEKHTWKKRPRGKIYSSTLVVLLSLPTYVALRVHSKPAAEQVMARHFASLRSAIMALEIYVCDCIADYGSVISYWRYFVLIVFSEGRFFRTMKSFFFVNYGTYLPVNSTIC